MGTIKVDGLDNVSQMLNRLRDKTAAIIKMGVHDGAGVLARAISDAIDALPTDSGPLSAEHPIMQGPTKIQKEGLQDGFGISRMRTDEGDFINVSIGFSGYNEMRTKKYPMGQPNQLIARSVEFGTSYMQKQPFVRRAVSKTKKQAIEAMQKKVSSVARNIAERTE